MGRAVLGPQAHASPSPGEAPRAGLRPACARWALAAPGWRWEASGPWVPVDLRVCALPLPSSPRAHGSAASGRDLSAILGAARPLEGGQPPSPPVSFARWKVNEAALLKPTDRQSTRQCGAADREAHGCGSQFAECAHACPTRAGLRSARGMRCLTQCLCHRQTKAHLGAGRVRPEGVWACRMGLCGAVGAWPTQDSGAQPTPFQPQFPQGFTRPGLLMWKPPDPHVSDLEPTARVLAGGAVFCRK